MDSPALAEELRALAERLRHTAARASDAPIAGTLGNLKAAAVSVGESWSGSLPATTRACTTRIFGRLHPALGSAASGASWNRSRTTRPANGRNTRTRT